MKVLVIGTSNSLLRDGLAAMAREYFGQESVDNKSIGNVAGSIYALTHVIDGIDFDRYDLIILDLLVNESYMREKYVAGKFIDACAELFYSSLPKGVRCIHFFYAHQGAFEQADATELMHKELCGRYGIGIVNVREILHAQCVQQNISLEEMFIDHAHFKTDLVRPVALSAFSDLNSFRQKYSKTAKHRSLFSIFPEGFPTVDRSNSLRSGQYALLSEGDSITIPKDCRTLGFFFHHYSTSCFMNFSGDQPLCKSMIFKGSEPYVNFTTWSEARYRRAGDRIYPTKRRANVERLEWTAGSISGETAEGTIELGRLYFVSNNLESLVIEARGVAFS